MKKKGFQELKTAKERVRLLLKEMPNLRNSDMSLIATYIHKEVGSQISEMSALDLLAKIYNSKVTSFETIRSARIIAQRNLPELRGEEYGKRKKSVKIPLFKVNIKEE
jgi:hypothetical protein